MLHLAFHRFGLGPSPAEMAEPPRDPRAWVLAQLDAPPLPEVPSAARLKTYEEGLGILLLRRAAQQRDPSPQAMAALPQPALVVDAEVAHRLELARTTAAPLIERLALHWANHFTVSLLNGTVAFVGGAMEREAIRPNLLGRFEAMLTACVTHPAMLMYLNNEQSIGPGSTVGRRTGRGLNENLAREVLELHTLGVDGGYTQQDVIELAKVLTGWTVRLLRPAEPLPDRVGFFAPVHEPGPKTILGRTYPDDGPDQLRAVLRDLARHPATARHATRRLAVHFLGEDAGAKVAPALAAVWRETTGDLGAVTRALLNHPLAWSAPPAKMRPPIEFLFAAARMLGGLAGPPAPRRALLAMGQPWLTAPAPAGWPEEDDAWAAPDSVKTRLDWSLMLAARLNPRHDARALAEASFGPALSEPTRRALQRAASGGQAMTLLLMSPEFQRR